MSIAYYPHGWDTSLAKVNSAIAFFRSLNDTEIIGKLYPIYTSVYIERLW